MDGSKGLTVTVQAEASSWNQAPASNMEGLGMWEDGRGEEAGAA